MSLVCFTENETGFCYSNETLTSLLLQLIGYYSATIQFNISNYIELC